MQIMAMKITVAVMGWEEAAMGWEVAPAMVESVWAEVDLGAD